jgi:Integrase zinc binding domain
MHQGILRYKRRICVGATGNLRQTLLQEVHDSIQGGHYGIDVTYHRLIQLLYWPLMKHDVIIFAQSCTTCQMTKSEHNPTPDLLQPLPVPHTPWSSVGLDFIIGLPKSEGKEVILVVVDRFIKFAHLIPLTHPYSASDVAHQFFQHIYTLHGMPTSIILDRDPVFTSNF